MCGIFGFTLKYDFPEIELKKMGSMMIHRGPDGEGYYFDSHIGMGMRRLSIIDIEKGDQPFYSNDNSVIVFCNGEIYNFKILRKELEQKGYKFYTDSDIEVLPHLYQEYGINFLNKLNGMFAISIYDKKKEKLFLIRDRLGIKPLYYSIVDDSIIYSSEIKPILELNKVNKDVDFEALSTYLDLMYIPKPMTPFSQIKKLDSGAYLVWKKGKHAIYKYWDINLSNTNKTESEHYIEMKDLLEDSIEKQLISDVPIGSFLSGGIDSSFVTAVSGKISKDDFFVFHMRWKNIGGKIDESKYAHRVADNFNFNKNFVDTNEIDVINLIPKLIYYLEEPFADAAFIPTYYLANLASENVKVILSGAGGDELFGGYGHHKNNSIIVMMKSIVKKILYNRNPAFSYYDKWKRGNRNYWKNAFPWYISNSFKTTFEKIYKENRHVDSLNAIMLNDIEYYLQDDILFLTDKMTMATSLECRVPLLDHRVVETAQKINSDLKIKNGEKKYFFKKIAEEYVPKEVLYRKKEGFGFPIEKWINEYKELYFDILMENGYLIKNNLISLKKLRKFSLRIELSRQESWFYWQIIVLEIWFQLFIEGKKYEDIFNL